MTTRTNSTTTAEVRRTPRLLLACVAAITVLAGCGGQAPPPVGEPPATPPPGAGVDPDPRAAPGPTDAATPSSPPSTDGDEPATSTDDGTGDNLEMPQAPEEEVTSLSELVDEVSDAPLVRVPLPRAASARGRLVSGYPTALRPTRSTRVESSSISPSGDRLQVALVGWTRLSAEQVLVAYRTRLSARGLVEQESPTTNAGSFAAAFQRGDSVVTLTVTPEASRTTYLVQATLRAGRS